MYDGLELAKKMYFFRLKSVYRTATTAALTFFIAGVALTQVLYKLRPGAIKWVLVTACVVSLLNALYSYVELQLSKAAHKQSLAELRAMNPELADELERRLP